jgi:hypothetical protein
MNSSELDHQLTNLTKIAVSLAIYGWSKVQKAHILYIYLNHESYSYSAGFLQPRHSLCSPGSAAAYVYEMNHSGELNPNIPAPW